MRCSAIDLGRVHSGALAAGDQGSIVAAPAPCAPRYWRFLARRFLRIWPMLAVMVAMGLVAARLSSAPQNPACGSNWWRILLFINNYAPKKCQHGHAWCVRVSVLLCGLCKPAALLWYGPSIRAAATAEECTMQH